MLHVQNATDELGTDPSIYKKKSPYVGVVKKNRLPHGLGELISKKGKLFYRGKFAEGRICPFDVVRQVKDDKEALKFIQFMGGKTEEDYKDDGFWCACVRG